MNFQYTFNIHNPTSTITHKIYRFLQYRHHHDDRARFFLQREGARKRTHTHTPLIAEWRSDDEKKMNLPYITSLVLVINSLSENLLITYRFPIDDTPPSQVKTQGKFIVKNQMWQWVTFFLCAHMVGSLHCHFSCNQQVGIRKKASLLVFSFFKEKI